MRKEDIAVISGRDRKNIGRIWGRVAKIVTFLLIS
jgi:hypothetical protein